MAESVPVRCPACRREHLYAAPSYPCACGAPVSPALDRRADPVPVTEMSWDEEWITVRCGPCGREDQWPAPELGCSCGTVLRIPTFDRGPGDEPDDDATGLRAWRRGAIGPHGPRFAVGGAGSGTEGTAPGTDEGAAEGTGPAPADDTPCGTADSGQLPPGVGDIPKGAGLRAAGRSVPGIVRRAPRPGGPPYFGTQLPSPRPAFQPITIRTARDAVTAAALYLRWLGYRDIRRADQRPPSGVGLAARGLLAQVDPSVNPASLRDVECLWLTAMTESTSCVFFSLAGYDDAARSRADGLRIPLFVLDLTGTPQPVNSPADELVATGA